MPIFFYRSRFLRATGGLRARGSKEGRTEVGREGGREVGREGGRILTHRVERRPRAYKVQDDLMGTLL